MFRYLAWPIATIFIVAIICISFRDPIKNFINRLKNVRLKGENYSLSLNSHESKQRDDVEEMYQQSSPKIEDTDTPQIEEKSSISLGGIFSLIDKGDTDTAKKQFEDYMKSIEDRELIVSLH
ncbi:MAG: hypothetical protein PHV85_10275, partial [Desulfovibrionaceae bacterium]|nr:hypothetical protein [Desulfovibrionaceae bacterium]